MPPDTRVLDVLRRARRQVRLLSAAHAVNAGAWVALVILVITRQGALALGSGALVALGYWFFTRDRRRHIAAQLEARVSECHNLIVTAEALLNGTLQAKPEVRAVVLDDAARKAETINPGLLWPLRRPLVAFNLAVGLLILANAVPPGQLAGLAPRPISASAMLPVVDHVDVVVKAPEYTGRPDESSRDPERIVALAGSRARLDVTSAASTVTIETESGRQSLTRGEDGRFFGETIVETDGYIAIAPADEQGRTGARRLIGVTAQLDRAPEVRIVDPGKDLFLKAATAPLSVKLQATDDLGLRTVKLAFTKVAGAGESFTFTEGEAPVTVTRANDREWTATGVLPLTTMALDVGDMVVYRGVAIDGRPGAAPVESDAFIVEIVSASNAVAEGFAIDDRQDKYALSQQMVIVKTERLIAKAATLTKEDLTDEAMGIAAEQRSVRAEIVFMMGGEFEDELVEAAHEGELTDGRLDNSGRADLGVATRAMSRAATLLIDGDLKTALTTERAALAAMQRALSRRRFILRTLTERGRIDATRRLQGRLDELGRGARDVEAPAISALATAARRSLRVVIDVSRQTDLTAVHAAQLSDAAAGLLAADGRGAAAVDVASRLSGAAEAIVKGSHDVARQALADAVSRLTAVASGGLTSAPLAGQAPGAASLRGALADALRGGGVTFK